MMRGGWKFVDKKNKNDDNTTTRGLLEDTNEPRQCQINECERRKKQYGDKASMGNSSKSIFNFLGGRSFAQDQKNIADQQHSEHDDDFRKLIDENSIVNSIDDSSKDSFPDELIPLPSIKNYARWQPIENDDSTKPLGSILVGNPASTRVSRQNRFDCDNTRPKTSSGSCCDKVFKLDFNNQLKGKAFDPFDVQDIVGEVSQTNFDDISEQLDISVKPNSSYLQSFSFEQQPQHNWSNKVEQKQSEELLQPTSQKALQENVRVIDDCSRLSNNSNSTALRKFRMEESYNDNDNNNKELDPFSSHEYFSIEEETTFRSRSVASDGTQELELESSPTHNSLLESRMEYSKRVSHNNNNDATDGEYDERRTSSIFLDESRSLKANIDDTEVSVIDIKQQQDLLYKFLSPSVRLEKESSYCATIVVLLSNLYGTRQQRPRQQRALLILKGKNIFNIEEIDGSTSFNKDRRNRLFEVSGFWGKYPQFFLQQGENNVIYLGDYDWVEYMNDAGSLTNETMSQILASSLNEESIETKVDQSYIISTEDCGGSESLSRPSVSESLSRQLLADRPEMLDLFTDEVVQKDNTESEKDIVVVDEISDSVINFSVPHIDNGLTINHELQNLGDTGSIDSNSQHYGSVSIIANDVDVPLSLSPCMDQSSFITQPKPTKDNRKPAEISAVDNKAVKMCSQRKIMLSSVGSLLDTDSENDRFLYPEQVQTTSFNSLVDTRLKSVVQQKMLNDKEEQPYDIGKSKGFLKDPEIRVTSKNILSISKLNSQVSGASNEKSKKQPTKDHVLLAEKENHLGFGCDYLSGNVRCGSPLGSSFSEIDMMNVFVKVIGTTDYFNLSTEEFEELHDRAQRAGLTESFVNKMLDQSVGIIAYESDEMCSSGRRGYLTKHSTNSNFGDNSNNNKDECVSKSPERNNFKLSCLKSVFWAESSNLVGANMIENVKSALSMDSESS